MRKHNQNLRMEVTLIKVAGIDPGLRTTGWGIVNYDKEKNEVWASHCGLLRTPLKLKGTEALLWMIKSLKEIAKRECFKDCAKIVVEFPAAFFNPKFSMGAITPVAAISGACMALFENDAHPRIFPVYPAVWNGGKKKDKMAILIQDLIGLTSEWEYDEKPTREVDFEHVIDAIGMAYWRADIEFFSHAKESIWKQKKQRIGLH